MGVRFAVPCEGLVWVFSVYQGCCLGGTLCVCLSGIISWDGLVLGEYTYV